MTEQPGAWVTTYEGYSTYIYAVHESELEALRFAIKLGIGADVIKIPYNTTIDDYRRGNQ